MLVAARDAGVKRLVYAGSSSAYGNTPTLPKREDMATASAVAVRAAEAGRRAVLPDVHAALRPRDGDDPLLQRLRAAPGSRVAVLRRDLAVHHARCSTARAPTIYGDGEQTRDFTYVANVVDGVLRACDAPGASGEVINVATGGRISLNELFTTLREHRRRQGASRVYADGRAGDVRDSQADITKAKRLLGYRPVSRSTKASAGNGGVVPSRRPPVAGPSARPGLWRCRTPASCGRSCVWRV